MSTKFLTLYTILYISEILPYDNLIKLKFSLMSLNYAVIIVNSAIASASKQSNPICIVVDKFLIALGTAWSLIATWSALLDLMLFLKTSVF